MKSLFVSKHTRKLECNFSVTACSTRQITSNKVDLSSLIGASGFYQHDDFCILVQLKN